MPWLEEKVIVNQTRIFDWFGIFIRHSVPTWIKVENAAFTYFVQVILVRCDTVKVVFFKQFHKVVDKELVAELLSVHYEHP